MKKYKLSFLEIFNVMRVFFNMRYDKTHSDKLGTLCGALNLWKQKSDWKESPQTFDPTAWTDWLRAVEKTLHSLHSTQGDPKKVIYDEEIAFLCMKNYLQCFYNQTLWEDIGLFLEEVKKVQHVADDSIWSEWYEAIEHVLHETYELDVYFDPFSGERID